jgi:hypothetical protein
MEKEKSLPKSRQHKEFEDKAQNRQISRKITPQFISIVARFLASRKSKTSENIVLQLESIVTQS